MILGWEIRVGEWGELPDRKRHKGGGQLLAAKVEIHRAFFKKTAGAIEGFSLEGRVYEDVREQYARDHGQYVFEERAADTVLTVSGHDAKQPDLVHVESGDTKYLLFSFENRHIKEPRPFCHTFGCFGRLKLLAQNC